MVGFAEVLLNKKQIIKVSRFTSISIVVNSKIKGPL